MRATPVIGAVAIAATLLSACGSSSKSTSAERAASSRSETTTTQAMGHGSSGSMSSSGAAGADGGASTLRGALTGLLEDHVYLAGITTGTALSGGDFKVPAGVLDQNSVALSKAIGSVYGDAAGTQFLALWRKHIGFFVDYTTGRATKNAAMVAKAQADLDGYRNDFGAFLASANPNLTKEAVAEELKGHVESLEAAIDAQAAKSDDATAKLQAAAAHMPMTADILAGAIAKQFPDKFTGNADGGASTLRGALTGLLEDHVYLAGLTTGTALSGGDFKVPAGVLDQNSVALSKAIGSVYGDAAGTQFLALWRKHIGFFVDYTTGRATKNAAMVAKAQADLDGYRNDFGAFLASANPNLTKEAVAEELKGHVESLEAAIDAQAAKSADATAKLQAAAAHMPMTADILAGAIAKQYPDKFSG